jgi:hypothetical protein
LLHRIFEVRVLVKRGWSGFYEKEDEVEDTLRKPGEDRPGQENSRISIGQTRGGGSLPVIYVITTIGQYFGEAC